MSEKKMSYEEKVIDAVRDIMTSDIKLPSRVYNSLDEQNLIDKLGEMSFSKKIEYQNHIHYEMLSSLFHYGKSSPKYETRDEKFTRDIYRKILEYMWNLGFPLEESEKSKRPKGTYFWEERWTEVFKPFLEEKKEENEERKKELVKYFEKIGILPEGVGNIPSSFLFRNKQRKSTRKKSRKS